MHNAPLRFRFTLARLCMATTFSAACVAMLTWPYHPEATTARVVAAFVLAGAGLGTLFGSARAGAAAGFTAFLVVVAILLFVVSWLFPIRH